MLEEQRLSTDLLPSIHEHDEDSRYETQPIELQNLEPDGSTTENSEATEPDHSRNEQWQLLKNSNPLSRLFRKIWEGPDEPKDDPPTFFERNSTLANLNSFPKEIFQPRTTNKAVKFSIMIVYCTVWFSMMLFLLFSNLLVPSYFIPQSDKDHRIPIISLECNSYLNWEGTNNDCGPFAKDCQPFQNKEYYIKCPALCDMGGIAYSAVAVGSKRVKYTNYIIGGGQLPNWGTDNDLISHPYRADSYPCAAGAHLGVISPFEGGCARISMEGYQPSFPIAKGVFKMGYSVAFNSFFPSSFSFKQFGEGVVTGCSDPRIPVLLLNILFGVPIFYLFESIYGYWIITIVAYWTLVLALDPPMLADAHDMASVYELFSIGFQRLLPLGFILYVIWKCSVKRTLEDGSPLLKIVLWYSFFWLGVMNNITFDRLPVDRLNMKDLQEQPGALTAVGAIFATILLGVFVQAYSIWKSGRFRKYFKIYITMILGLFFLGSIPGLNLRIHHYILGILLVPGCATRGTSAYLFQGILIGLVLSGVGRWDFASIVETDFALLRGEAGASMKPPMFVFDESYPHSISWELKNTEVQLDLDEPIDGYSLLMNDFEVYVGMNETVSIDQLIEENQMLSDMINEITKYKETKNEESFEIYFRVARASLESPSQYRGDYTNAGILIWPEGIWYDPLPGVS